MDDLISRQAAIDALNKLDVSDGVGISSIACDLQEEAIRSIKSLPSAQPERIRGRWIKMSDADGDYYVCDQCSEELPRYTTKSPTWDIPYPTKYSIDKTNFCPNCGADMREDQ